MTWVLNNDALYLNIEFELILERRLVYITFFPMIFILDTS
jgi:hypothetical protein